MIALKKKELTGKEKKLAELKEDLKECRRRIKRAEGLFDFATDENLIESKIYEMKSLVKHHDYLTASIRRLLEEEKQAAEDITAVNI